MRVVAAAAESLNLERDGIADLGITNADEMEDYLELRDARVNARIATARREFQAGKGRPAARLLEELNAIARRSSEKATRGQQR